MTGEHIAYDGEDYTPSAGSSAVLPEDTRVLVSIVPTRKEGFDIERRPFATQGDNANITALAIHFRIADGQVKQNGRLFENIPLARKFRSGKTAHSFGGFFSALGFDVNNKAGFTVPADSELLGKFLTVTVGVELDNKGNLRNRVKFFDKAGPGTPLDDFTGELLHSLSDLPPTHPLRIQAQQRATVTGQAAGAPVAASGGWTPPPATGAPAQAAVQGWMPPQADVQASIDATNALAAAAASTPGY